MNEYLKFMYDDGTPDGDTSTDTNTDTTTSTEEQPQTKTELLREISADLGINAFDPKEVKAKFAEYEAWKESQMTEQEKKDAELEALRNEKTEWARTQQSYEATLEATKLGIAPDNLDDALKLAGNDPSKLKEVVEKYPVFLSNKNVSVGITGSTGDNPSGKTEAQQYMEKNYSNSRYYKKT